MRTREELLDRLDRDGVPDIVIIGGGINGVGVYRDLAAQGIAALLVEAGDFASGTSAAPSRLIHGGLRYLETGEAALVRESLTERNLLLRNAGHLVHPLPVWIPLKSWFSGSVAAVLRFLRLTRVPGAKGAVPVKLGLILYDLFGRVAQTMPNHRFLGAAAARAAMPVLARDIRAVAEFHDARITHPERLVLEIIGDAEADCPASLAIPYLAAGGVEAGRLSLVDALDGRRHSVAPRLVINASGAWVDRVQGAMGFEGRLIGGTRGSHLVLRNPELAAALGPRMLYFETEDHRACLVYALDAIHAFLGTTDIRSDDPDDRSCTEDEIDYLFRVLAPYVPEVPLGREQIVFTVAGVRPLPRQDAAATGAISRDHRIDTFPPEPNRPFEVLTLVGGKWTTYRAFAAQVVDRVLARLGKPRRADTAELPIGGGRDFPREGRAERVDRLARETGIAPARAHVLAARYGSAARRVALAEAAAPGGFATLEGYSRAEIALICREERVTRLDDILLRRTAMGFEGKLSAASVSEAAEVAAETLGWDAARRDAEIARARALLESRHGVRMAAAP